MGTATALPLPLLARLRSALRRPAMAVHLFYLRHAIGHRIGANCIVSFKARLDRTNPRGVHIGRDTGIALGVVILAHDFTRNRLVDTRIGARCLIGAHAIVGPGVTVGDGTIVAPGAVVLSDLPGGCVAVGNPARVVERGICTGRWGVRIDCLPAERIDPRVLPREPFCEAAE